MLHLNETDNSQNYSDLHATNTPVEDDVAGRLPYKYTLSSQMTVILVKGISISCFQHQGSLDI